MVIVKDTDEQIVLHNEGWLRVVLLVCSIPLSLLFCAIGIVELATEGHWNPGIGMLLIGLILGFVTYYLANFFGEITFDRTLGKMTIRRGAKPFFVRTRRISRTEIQGVDLEHIPGSGYGNDATADRWRLFLRVGPNGKKVCVAEPFGESYDKITETLADRIRDFQRGQ